MQSHDVRVTNQTDQSDYTIAPSRGEIEFVRNISTIPNTGLAGVEKGNGLQNKTPSNHTLNPGIAVNTFTAAEGYIAGFTDGTMRPNDKVTREQFVVMLDRLFVINATGGIHATYGDYQGRWSESSIRKLQDAGILADTDSTTSFRPSANMTREEAVLMIARIVDVSGYQAATTLTDLNVNSSAKHNTIARAYNAKLVAGMGGKFVGNGNLTRAEAVALLNRIIYTDLSTNKVNTYKDMKTTAWYYDTMIKASR